MEVNFDCDELTKQCHCAQGSCTKICNERTTCKNYQFYCSNQSDSCSVLCLSHNSCDKSKFYVLSTSSSVRCVGINSCNNSLFECGSKINETKKINNCVLQIESSSLITSQFLCHGNIDECRFELIQNYNDTILANENEIYLNKFLANEINVWIVTVSFMISIVSSCLLYYCCLNLCDFDRERGEKQNTEQISGISQKQKNGTKVKKHDTDDDDNKKIIKIKTDTIDTCIDTTDTIIKSKNKSAKNAHFESSFWLTILSTLFNDDGDKTDVDGLECGIILIPSEAIEEVLRRSVFRGCQQCKVPVTEQFLKHYGKTSRKPNSYIIIQSGYIYGYEIYHHKKNNNVYEIAKVNSYIVIDSQKKKTQKSSHEYYRVFVNNVRVKSADEFCTVLKQYGIDINLQNDETTTTWKVRESVEISPEIFESKAEGMAATNVALSLHYLQERRSHRTHPEMVGATIVVIPYNKSLSDFKLYLRQYLNVSMPISDSSLYCIFTHNSVLHDGAIFVRGNYVIAVKAFFRITGEYKNKPSIGHGTRHTSALEFSKHARRHKPITFVLSEEDGLIRSCIAGEIKKIKNYKFIPRLLIEHHHTNYTEKVDQEMQQESQLQEGQTITEYHNPSFFKV